MLPASEAIYGRYLLLRTAAVIGPRGCEWSIPTQVPDLVAQVYDDASPVSAAWADVEQQARSRWAEEQRQRAENAQPILLTRVGEHERPTLEGVHYGATKQELGDERVQALVRDGEPSIEVVLVQRDDKGYQTLQGQRLGINGDVSTDLVDDGLGGTVWLPSFLTDAAQQELGPLDGWRDDPWPRHSRGLVVSPSGDAVINDVQLRYDEVLGLVRLR